MIVAASHEEAAGTRALLRQGWRWRRIPSLERGHLAGVPVLLLVTGAGARAAAASLASLERELPLAGLIAVGVSGALSPELTPGALAVGAWVQQGGLDPQAPPPSWLERALALPGARRATLVSAPRLLLTADEKEAAGRGVREPPAAVDLETWQVALAARQLGLPWIALRVISDGAREDLPPLLGRCSLAGGGLDRRCIALQALRHPGQMAGLWHLLRRTRQASARLARALEALLPGLAPGLEDQAQGPE